jgi:hypothetical protein
MPSRFAVSASILVIAAAVGGCVRAEESAPPTPSPNVVTMHAIDNAYHGPDTVPAGMTTIKLLNGGTTFHHLIVARLDSGKTMADAQAAFANPGPPPAWLVNIGGPNAPDPQGESNATLDLAAGQYVVYCLVDLPGGVPHVAKGMIKPLVVTPAAGETAAAPAADIEMELFDYNFVLSKPITAGMHTFKVTTRAGGQPHEVEIVRLADGKTADDFMQWMGGKMDTPPPGSGVGGVLALTPGTPVYFTADFTPGNYLLICFIPEGQDGKPHALHGMTQAVSIN